MYKRQAVGGGVVVAKDVDGLALADGGLRDVGQQVVRDALGVLAHKTAGVEMCIRDSILPVSTNHRQVWRKIAKGKRRDDALSRRDDALG